VAEPLILGGLPIHNPIIHPPVRTQPIHQPPPVYRNTNPFNRFDRNDHPYHDRRYDEYMRRKHGDNWYRENHRYDPDYKYYYDYRNADRHKPKPDLKKPERPEPNFKKPEARPEPRPEPRPELKPDKSKPDFDKGRGHGHDNDRHDHDKHRHRQDEPLSDGPKPPSGAGDATQGFDPSNPHRT